MKSRRAAVAVNPSSFYALGRMRQLRLGGPASDVSSIGFSPVSGCVCLVTARGHRYSATTLSLPIQAQGILGEAV